MPPSGQMQAGADRPVRAILLFWDAVPHSERSVDLATVVPSRIVRTMLHPSRRPC